MTSPDLPVIDRMQSLIRQWQATSDQRAVFLDCYAMMTRNILSAIDRREFADPAWVDRFLQRFADYYFIALEAYERAPAEAPRVWQVAHNAARQPEVWALQKLLLGVNAHINYDLVLTLAELLAPEWPSLTESQRNARQADYAYVNEIISRTVDAVQDQVLDPLMPVMEIIDRMMGRVDELLISRLLTHWREQVWHYALRLLASNGPGEQDRLLREVEAEALRHAHEIVLKGWTSVSGVAPAT